MRRIDGMYQTAIRFALNFWKNPSLRWPILFFTFLVTILTSYYFLSLSTEVIHAASCQSNGSGGGNWSSNSSWQDCGGTTPQSGDSVTILISDSITLDSASVMVASITINNGGTLTVSGSNAISVSSDWTNNGTFTASTGTVTFTATTTGKTLSGTMIGSAGKFYNLTLDGSGGGWTFSGAVEVANDFNVTNGAVIASNNDLTVTRDFILANAAGVSYTAGSSTIRADRHWTDTGNKYVEGTSTVSLQGTGTLTSGGTLYNLSIGYTSNTTTIATNNSIGGVLTFNGGTVTKASGFNILNTAAAISTPVVFASPTTLSGTNTLSHDSGSASRTINVTSANYGSWRVEITRNHNSVTHTLTAGTLTTTGGMFLASRTGNTGGIINFNGATIQLTNNDMRIGNGTGELTINADSSSVTVEGVVFVSSTAGSSNHTLNLNTSTWTVMSETSSIAWTNIGGSAQLAVNPGTSTVNFNQTTGGTLKDLSSSGQSFYNIRLNSSASGTTGIRLEDNLDVNNNLTIEAGDTLDTKIGENNSITIGNSYTNNGTFIARSGTVTFDATDTSNVLSGTLDGSSAFYDLTFNGAGGSWSNSSALLTTNDLTLTNGELTGTNNVTVNGNVVGTNGSTFFTGGTFEQSVAADKNFGTTSGSSHWIFYNLTFSTTTSSQTITTQTGGSGTITVSGVLTVFGTGSCTGSEGTFNAGNRTWTLSGTTGTPLVSSCGILTPSTSTIRYTGNNTSGNTTITPLTYNNLTINNSAESYVLGGAINNNGDLTIAAGELDVTLSNHAVDIKGNYSNSGTFISRNGTVTLSGTSTQILSGTMTSSSAFYDLTINNNSGASPSDCERTGFIASVDFDTAATVTHDYTITAPSVRIEYNDGSRYTFNNINWNGQASGSQIYFRNSSTTGTWELNQSGTQTVSYVNVSQSDASSGNEIIANDGTNTDCNNNTNWSFPITTTPSTPSDSSSDTTGTTSTTTPTLPNSGSGESIITLPIWVVITLATALVAFLVFYLVRAKRRLNLSSPEENNQ